MKNNDKELNNRVIVMQEKYKDVKKKNEEIKKDYDEVTKEKERLRLENEKLKEELEKHKEKAEELYKLKNNQEVQKDFEKNDNNKYNEINIKETKIEIRNVNNQDIWELR